MYKCGVKNTPAHHIRSGIRRGDVENANEKERQQYQNETGKMWCSSLGRAVTNAYRRFVCARSVPDERRTTMMY